MQHLLPHWLRFKKELKKPSQPIKAVREALASLDIVTFYGQIKFSDNGMNGSKELPIIQVQNGVPVPLYPDSVKKGNLRPFK